MRIIQSILITAFVATLATTALCQSTQPATQRVLKAGTLIRVEGTQLVIQPMWQPPDAPPVFVSTDPQSRIILDNERSTFEEIRPGMELSARREAPTDQEPNPRLIVHAWSPSSTGLISKVEGAAIHLKRTPSGAEPVSPIVRTDKDTRIVRVASLVGDTWDEGGPMKLDELKPEMLVKAMPPKGVASRIFVWPARISPQAATAPTESR